MAQSNGTSEASASDFPPGMRSFSILMFSSPNGNSSTGIQRTVLFPTPADSISLHDFLHLTGDLATTVERLNNGAVNKAFSRLSAEFPDPSERMTFLVDLAKHQDFPRMLDLGKQLAAAARQQQSEDVDRRRDRYAPLIDQADKLVALMERIQKSAPNPKEEVCRMLLPFEFTGRQVDVLKAQDEVIAAAAPIIAERSIRLAMETGGKVVKLDDWYYVVREGENPYENIIPFKAELIKETVARVTGQVL